MDWMTEGTEFKSQYGQEVSLLHIIQTGSWAHPTSHPIGTGALSPGLKRQRCETDHSPPTIPEVKKAWIYTSTLPHVFIA
jgi:hypothetical protein